MIRAIKWMKKQFSEFPAGIIIDISNINDVICHVLCVAHISIYKVSSTETCLYLKTFCHLQMLTQINHADKLKV